MQEQNPKSFPNRQDIALLLNREGGAEHAERFTQAAWISVIDELIRPQQPETAASLHERVKNAFAAQDDGTKFQLDKEINKILLQVVTPPSSQEREALDAWTASDAGQKTLRETSRGIVGVLGGIRQEGIAGHGLDHFARETLIALRFQQEGVIQGYQQAGIFASLLHDVGRVSEHFAEGKRHGGLEGYNHAKVSMTVAKSILDDFPELPPRIRLEILHAIAIHQSSSPIEQHLHDNALMAYETRQSDQADIVGLGFKRMVEFDIGREGLSLEILSGCLDSGELPLPGTDDDQSLLQHSLFYLFFLFPDVDRHVEAFKNARKAETLAFWLIVAQDDPKLQQQILAPMRIAGIPNSEKRLPEEVVRIAQEEMNGLQAEIDHVVSVHGNNLEQLILAYIDKPNSGSEEYVQNVIQKVSEIPAGQRSGFLRGFAYMMIKKQRLTEELIQGGRQVDSASWQAPIIDWAIQQLT